MITNEFPKTIYHYCSVDAFYSIIKSKSLRLTNIKYFRDSTEGIRLIQFFDKAIKTYDTTNIALLKKIKLEVTSDTERAFGVCFTEKSDDLNQWRSYADDGRGVALGFNAGFFRESNRLLGWSFNIDSRFYLEKVSYNQTEYENLLHYVYSLVEDIAEAYSEEDAIRVGNYLIRRLSIVCKHFSFSSEKEVRLFYVPESVFENSTFPLDKLTRKYYIRRDDLIPSYDYDLKEENPNSDEYLKCFSQLVLVLDVKYKNLKL